MPNHCKNILKLHGDSNHIERFLKESYYDEEFPINLYKLLPFPDNLSAK